MHRTILGILSTAAIVIGLLLLARANPNGVEPPHINCPDQVAAGGTLNGDSADPANQAMETEIRVDGEVVLLLDDTSGNHNFILNVLPEWAGKTIEISVTTEDGRTATKSVNVQ